MSKDINIVSRGTKQVENDVCTWIFRLFYWFVWQSASSSGLLENRILRGSYGCRFCFWRLLISGELWQHVKVECRTGLTRTIYWWWFRFAIGSAQWIFVSLLYLLDTTLPNDS